MAERTAKPTMASGKAGKASGQAGKASGQAGKASGQAAKASGQPAKGAKAGKKAKTVPAGPVRSGRYTPPIPRSKKTSPIWVPVLMMFLFLAGLVAVLVDYLGVLPGGASNWYLLGGIGLVFAGFITATQYR